MKLPLIGQAYEARSKSLNSQRCVNLYPVIDNSGGKNVGALYGTAGLTLFSTLEVPNIRGMLAASDGYLYVVAASEFIQIDSSGTATRKAFVEVETTAVSMYEGLGQILIITETKGYLWDFSTLTEITDADFIPGGDVSHINGYFIFNQPNTDYFSISSNTLTNPVTFPSNSFSYADVDSDNIVTHKGINQELWLFGDRTTEVWGYDANIDFPFSRIEGATMEIGCAARQSPVRMDNTFYWLAKNERGEGQIVRAEGYNPRVVSTPAIDRAIASYSTISDAVAYAYQQEGHLFYQITFPTANKTWVYDVTTQLWHEKASQDVDGILNRHRSLYYAYFAGKHIVSDYESNKLYEIDLDAYTDNGTNIQRIRSIPIQNNEGERIFWHEVQVDLEAGAGLEDNTDPILQLKWSDDGSRTWSNAHFGSMGKIGEYDTRVIFRRLGQSRSRVYELRTSTATKVALIDMYAKVS